MTRAATMINNLDICSTSFGKLSAFFKCKLCANLKFLPCLMRREGKRVQNDFSLGCVKNFYTEHEAEIL